MLQQLCDHLLSALFILCYGFALGNGGGRERGEGGDSGGEGEGEG